MTHTPDHSPASSDAAIPSPGAPSEPHEVPPAPTDPSEEPYPYPPAAEREGLESTTGEPLGSAYASAPTQPQPQSAPDWRYGPAPAAPQAQDPAGAWQHGPPTTSPRAQTESSWQYGPPPGSTPQGAGAPPPTGFTPPPYSNPARPQRNEHWTQRYLVRSREDRMIAGVAGGVARRLGVDPLIVRILLVILAFFGGVGVLLYGLGWLLLPDDDGRRRSLLEDTTSGRSPTRTRNLLLVAVLVTAIVISGVWVLSGQVIPVVLLALTLTALYLYARRDNFQPAWPGPYAGAPAEAGSYPQSAGAPGYGGTAQAPGPPFAAPPTPYVPAPQYEPVPQYDPAPRGTPVSFEKPTSYGRPGTDESSTQYGGSAGYDGGTYEPALAATHPAAPAYFSASASTAPYPPAPGGTGFAGGSAGGSHAYVPPAGYPPPTSPPPEFPVTGATPPKPPRERRERSYLGPLTISVALVALGVLAAVDASGAQVPGTGYVGVALGAVALGLLVGAWIGRSRGLIFLGVLLCIAMIPAAVADTATDDDWSRIGDWGNAETVREAPTLASDIRPAYDLGSGRLLLDLRNVDFTGEDVMTSLSLGAGEISVLVPADVDVTATGAVDMGQLLFFGSESAGVDVDSQRTDLGADGVGGGTLELMIDVNVGNAEVRREAA